MQKNIILFQQTILKTVALKNTLALQIKKTSFSHKNIFFSRYQPIKRFAAALCASFFSAAEKQQVALKCRLTSLFLHILLSFKSPNDFLQIFQK